MTATSRRQLRSCEGRMEIHHATTPRKPAGPNCEPSEGRRQRQTHPGPWQIRIVDGQRGPRDRYGPAERDDDRDQPAERPGQEAAKRTHWLLPLFHSAERIGVAACKGEKVCVLSWPKGQRWNVYRPDF